MELPDHGPLQRAIIEPAIMAAKANIEAVGRCLDSIMYVADNHLRLTIHVAFPEDDSGKYRLARALGRVGRVLNAEYIVVMADTFIRRWKPGDPEPATRPSQDPEALDALMVSVYTPAGQRPEYVQIIYRQNADGSYTWEPEEFGASMGSGGVGPMAQSIEDGFRRTNAALKLSLLDAVTAVGTAAVIATANPWDPDVKEALSGLEPLV